MRNITTKTNMRYQKTGMINSNPQRLTRQSHWKNHHRTYGMDDAGDLREDPLELTMRISVTEVVVLEN